MISDEELKFKSDTLKKFKEEQYKRMGGPRATGLGVGMGAAFYLGSGHFLNI